MQEEPKENETSRETEEISATGQSKPDGNEEVEIGQVEEEAEKPVARGGCLRGCLTPIAVVFAVLLVMIMIGYVKRDAIRDILLKRIIVNTRNGILSNLPEGMDANEIEAAFEKAKTALKESQIDEETLREVLEEYHNAVQKEISQEQKKQEINRLVTSLNAAIKTVIRDS